ncbi:MAG: 4-hydroxy-3-methylbut-2-enyl diphosphate reductase [Candidatus Obscuribacterales bacterium]|nr:4-hydroxy-3-methylbut-2-enyl diphosphate reductase [Candidatus Obscuribacterales bacterium]
MIKAGPTYHRKSFGLKDLVQEDLSREYESSLISSIRQNGYSLEEAGITIKLAKAFGFCWGVDRAVSMAYETRKQFPDKQIWITNEIIHNPLVNENLRQMQIKFVPQDEQERKIFTEISEGDVVILPAFGASVDEMRLLEAKNCEIVDTTCPWVSRVWNRVDKYKKSDFTAIIHGKYKHEETIATSSRSQNYLIVQDLAEAEWVCNYILQGGDKNEFLHKFKSAVSQGFDPDTHLNRLGVANQTTMLKGETESIGKLIERTMLAKYGAQKLDQHFLSPGDTICDATQERQDAMQELFSEPLDLVVVIGGYNSSNTGHLHEMAVVQNITAYHIDGPDCIVADNSIRHKLPHQTTEAIQKPFLPPEGNLTIGLSAGASTPDQVIAGVIEKIFSLRQTQPN